MGLQHLVSITWSHCWQHVFCPRKIVLWSFWCCEKDTSVPCPVINTVQAVSLFPLYTQEYESVLFEVFLFPECLTRQLPRFFVKFLPEKNTPVVSSCFDIEVKLWKLLQLTSRSAVSWLLFTAGSHLLLHSGGKQFCTCRQVNTTYRRAICWPIGLNPLC